MINKRKQRASEPLHPNEIIRLNEGPTFFGYKHSELDQKIKSGEIPTPFALSDGGRAKGWTGQQIIDYQRRRLAKACDGSPNAVNKTGGRVIPTTK